MKKLSIFLALLGAFSMVSTAYANLRYNNYQLTQFELTNKCSGCDLSDARLKSNHSNAILDNANLSGIRANDYQSSVNFSAANLQNANLSCADLEDSNFSQADLTGAHFDGAYLRYANFYGAKGANLNNAADLCYAILPDGTTKGC